MIMYCPVPDVSRIGGPNLFVYRTRDEFIAQVKTLMDNPATFHITLENYVGKRIPSVREYSRESAVVFLHIQIY